MDAVISDIHGNLEALDAVLSAIRELGADRIICLGDVVCYGPDSVECVRRSAAWNVLIAGEWDQAMTDHDPADWPPSINPHIQFVRQQIHSAPDADLLLHTLASYQKSYRASDSHFAHGTPEDVREWIFPEDVYNPMKLDRIARQFDIACVCGHSHIQGVFQGIGDSKWEFHPPVLGESYAMRADQKRIFCAGSVGQPRDGDPRACFLTIDGEVVRFHRVAYNVELTIDKIRSCPEIDNMHGDRLREGR